MVRTQISLDKKEYDTAKKQAATLGISLAEFIRRAVREHLPVDGILSRFSDQNLTLADAHGLLIMRERKTVMCWATDRHLAPMGAQLIIAM